MKGVQLQMGVAQRGIDLSHIKLEPEQLTIELERLCSPPACSSDACVTRIDA
jgi:Ni,Fe-hydrogenase III large subunit